MQAANQAEVERLTSQLQESIVATEVGRAKILMYDELSAKADNLVRGVQVVRDSTLDTGCNAPCLSPAHVGCVASWGILSYHACMLCVCLHHFALLLHPPLTGG